MCGKQFLFRYDRYWIERAASRASSDQRPAPLGPASSVEPKSGLDPLIQNLPVTGRFRAPCEEGHHMANPVRKPRTRAHFATEIATQWQRSREAIFAVGRLLISAKQQLEHGEFTAMVEND